MQLGTGQRNLGSLREAQALSSILTRGFRRPDFKRGKTMKEGATRGTRVLAILLIVGGVLGLVYGSFTYTQENHKANIGTVELSVKEKHTVTVPVGVGAGAIVAGAALLLL